MTAADLRARVEAAIRPGLVAGRGKPKPGAYSVEAAIALASGEPFGNKPTCIAKTDLQFLIHLNDAKWLTPAARAEALLPLALASLGTASADRSVWVARVVEGTIRRVLPIALRAAADAHHDAAHAAALRAAADRCEREGTREAADAAYVAADLAALAAAHAAYIAAARTAPAAACAARAAAFAACAARAADHDRASSRAAACAAACAAAVADPDRALHEAVAVALDAYAAEGRA